MNKLGGVLKKVFTRKAYAARTMKEDPLQAFLFRVTISGMQGEIGFTKVSGLSREVDVVEYFENMYEHAHKLPGREKVGEITFEKGLYADKTFLKEYLKVLGTSKNNFRHEITITILDRFGRVRRTFTLHEAWVSKYEIGDLDSASNDVILETMAVQYEYMACK